MNEEEKTQKEIEEKKEEKDNFQEIEKLKKEKEELLNDLKKAKADLINYKKEENERYQELIRFSNERIIKELITVLDSFELALNNLKNEEGEFKERYIKGIILIKSQLEDILKREGLEEIQVKKGEPPDLNFEEVVSEIETKEFKEGAVVEVFQKGYLLNGKIIRPARVAVAKVKEEL